MMTTHVRDIPHLVAGLGVTGLSCVRYLTAQGESCVVIDRGQPASEHIQACTDLGVPVHTQTWSEEWFARARKIWLSPGTALDDNAVAAHREFVTSDVEAFLAKVKVPVIGITGSNGKSTVTAWLTHVLNALGKEAVAAGNIGLPVLEALDRPADIYVLELSSFQLERLSSPGLDVAVLLNLSEDHMDRYQDIEAYAQAKRIIFHGASCAICHADDPRTWPESRVPRIVKVGQDLAADWRLHGDGVVYGGDEVLALNNLRLSGRHNLFNAAAVLAAATALGFDVESARAALGRFEGLPHRCRVVAACSNITWYNDSKATNVGATLAAVEGLRGRHSRIILLAGGLGKGQDFQPLRALEGQVAHVVLFGMDAPQIELVLAGRVPLTRVASLDEAVEHAADLAKNGDAVVLSPACASFDQFSGFAARGEAFEACVRRVCREGRS